MNWLRIFSSFFPGTEEWMILASCCLLLTNADIRLSFYWLKERNNWSNLSSQRNCRLLFDKGKHNLGGSIKNQANIWVLANCNKCIIELRMELRTELKLQLPWKISFCTNHEIIKCCNARILKTTFLTCHLQTGSSISFSVGLFICTC